MNFNIKRMLQSRIITRQGGEKTSLLLRSITNEKYKVDIGLYTYGSCFDPSFNVGGSVTIGRYCSFASDIHYYGANHPINNACLSAYFYNEHFSKLSVNDVPRYHLQIGNDVWIGARVNITCGCQNIGNGAIVGAGAVVTKDIPPYAIVGGVPATIIRYRFDAETIQLLEQSKWFELTPDEVMDFYDHITEPKTFAKMIITKKLDV